MRKEMDAMHQEMDSMFERFEKSFNNSRTSESSIKTQALPRIEETENNVVLYIPLQAPTTDIKSLDVDINKTESSVVVDVPSQGKKVTLWVRGRHVALESSYSEKKEVTQEESLENSKKKNDKKTTDSGEQKKSYYSTYGSSYSSHMLHEPINLKNDFVWDYNTDNQMLIITLEKMTKTSQRIQIQLDTQQQKTSSSKKIDAESISDDK